MSKHISKDIAHDRLPDGRPGFRSVPTRRVWRDLPDAEKDASGKFVRVYDPDRARRAADPYDPECSQYSWAPKPPAALGDPQ